MRSSEDLLEEAAREGTIDIAEWPRVLESVLQKLHNIVYNDFPLPVVPRPVPPPSTVDPDVVASTPPLLPTSDADHPAPETEDHELPDAEAGEESEFPPNSQSSTKENDAPSDALPEAVRPMPGFEVNHGLLAHGDGEVDGEMEDSALPPDLFSLYTTSTRVLERDFAHSPPYTVQRLAEMVLQPRKHYRFLPAYLRALDRVVSVSSPLTDFPLPTLLASSNGGFLTNGDSSHADSLGSDESLGGALLTPIPWLVAASATSGHDGELRSESIQTIDGPNGSGSIETVAVTVNGVPSATSIAHTSPAPNSPTLSEQSDASSSSSSGTVDAQLREQGAVTQGELLRQEQQAGVIPVSQAPMRRTLLANGAIAVGREPTATAASTATHADVVMADDTRNTDDHAIPHARGPEEIGMEDTGPQPAFHFDGDTLDIEGAVGRRSKSPIPPPVDVELDQSAARDEEDVDLTEPGKPGRHPADVEKDVERLREAMLAEKAEQAQSADGDVVVADADGRPVEGGAETGDTTAS